jgi:predicted ATPase/DNA-binding winged helix-turn-helix (wHTH) protein
VAAGQLEVRILGPLKVLAGDESMALGAHKQRALLALLAIHANEVVSSDELIESLWAGKPPKTAATTLHVYVSRLRKLLEPDRAKGDNHVLISRAPGYLLSIDASRIDAHRFESLAEDGRRRQDAGDATGAALALREALALWSGAALAEFVYEPWAEGEAARLEELRLAVLEERIAADLATGRDSELVPELEVLLAEHPLRERLHGHVMLALYRSGRQAEALESYQRARTRLTEELGLDPSPELQELNRQILTQDATLAAPERTPTLMAMSNLPTPGAGFVGRERELATVVGLLTRDDVRLASLTGPGGTGKTRLALQAAVEVRDEFPAGVYWVPLASLRDPSLVPSALSQALGVREQPGREPIDVLCERLAGQRLLVLLDNAEHLLPDLAQTVSQLRALAGPTLLVTSRERLNIAGEHAYAVPELDAKDSVDLFLARAEAAGVRLERTATVDELCSHLERLPLALELAAARAVVFSPQQQLERLAQRLDLLKGGRDADPRQQTLRATIEWSYDLLDNQEQRLFRALTVFAGGWTYEAAAEICEADPDTFQSLIEKSLVRRLDLDDNPRYSMLETIREYGRERLSEPEGCVVARRHAGYFVSFAEDAEQELVGSRQSNAMARFASEHENLRTARDWLRRDGDNTGNARLASAVWQFLMNRGHLSEGRAWMEQALSDRDHVSPALQAQVLFGSAILAVWQGDHVRAHDFADESLSIARARDDTGQVARALDALALASQGRGDNERAASLLEECRVLASEIGDEWLLGIALNNLGDLALKDGAYAHAAELFEESLVLGQKLGDLERIARSLGNLASAEIEQGRVDIAFRLLMDSLDHAAALGLVDVMGSVLDGAAAVAAARGDPERAVRLVAGAESLRSEIGAAQWRFEELRNERILKDARELLGSDGVATAFVGGTRMSLDEALDLARSID